MTHLSQEIHDDAVHILDPSHVKTLCGQAVREGMIVTRLYGLSPTAATGCWTCMQKAEATR